MDKDLFKGIKIGFGIILSLSLFFGIIFAIGFHSAEEILGGTFSGNYIFNDNVTFNGRTDGVSGGVPSTAVLDFNSGSCPMGFTLDSKQYVKESPTTIFVESTLDAGVYPASNLIDSNTGTSWVTVTLPTASDVLVSYKFTNPLVLERVRIYPKPDFPYLSFKNFGVYGSDDSSDGSDGTWDLIDSGFSTGSSAAWYSFDISNSNPYTWYKIVGPAQFYASSQYFIQTAEIEMYSSKVTCVKD